MSLKFSVKTNYSSSLRVTGRFPKTAKGAMSASIAKWEFARDWMRKNKAPLHTGGVYTCALCRLYYHGEAHCNNCPIAKHTGVSGCLTTPNEKYENSVGSGCSYSVALLHCVDEIKFLKKVQKGLK